MANDGLREDFEFLNFQLCIFRFEGVSDDGGLGVVLDTFYLSTFFLLYF